MRFQMLIMEERNFLDLSLVKQSVVLPFPLDYFKIWLCLSRLKNKILNCSQLDDKPLSALEPESADFLAKYFEAADNGRRNENCADLYTACSEVCTNLIMCIIMVLNL